MRTPPVRLTVQTGFSLVEMAIVLTIVGILMASLLPTVTSQIEQSRRTETRKQLAEIQQALLGFAIINGRLPCPTTEPNPANALYGQEPAAGCAVVPAVEGYLPWKTLGVSETDAWGSKRASAGDPWTGYWRYRVDRSFSNTVPPLFNLNTGFTDNLSVIDISGNPLTSAEHPVAIVFSTGPNVTADGENSIANFNAIYQSDNPSPNFDDILNWISRPQLFNRMVAAGKLP